MARLSDPAQSPPGDPISLRTGARRVGIETADGAAGSLGSRAMLPAIARAARDGAGADYAAVALVSSSGDITLFVPSGTEDPEPTGPWVNALGDIMIAAGLRSGARVGATARAPIVGRAGLIGWVHAGRADPFDDDELRALDDIARYAAFGPVAASPDIAATRRVATMLSALSHEVRTPLTVILGNARTLERHHGHLKPGARTELLRHLTVSALRLDRIFGDLLELGRVDRDPSTLHTRPADLAGLVRMVVAESEMLGARPLSVNAAAITLEVDAAKIERILEHLLANIRAHTPDGAPAWVRVEDHDDEVHLVVEDAGPGIPVAERQVIFEPLRVGSNARAFARDGARPRARRALHRTARRPRLGRGSPRRRRVVPRRAPEVRVGTRVARARAAGA